MKPSIRSLVLGLALLAAIAASVVGVSDEDAAPKTASVPRVPSATRAGLPPRQAVAAPVDAVPRRFGPPVANLFAVRAAPARPIQAAIPQPAASTPQPVAPALPFLYQGKLLEQDRVTAFLSLGPRTYLLRKGDVVADYRVVDIHAAGMTFVYLPLNIEQRLSFGSAN